jgi:hypothetical protein
LEKKLSACLSVRRVKKTFPIENTKISIFVLNDGSVMVGEGEGWSAPPEVKGTHFRGQKTFLIENIEISIFVLNDGLVVVGG